MLVGLTLAGLINFIGIIYFVFFKLEKLETYLRRIGIIAHPILSGKDIPSRIHRLSLLAGILALPTTKKMEGRISKTEIKKIPKGLLLPLKILFASLTLNFGLFFLHWIIYHDTLYKN